VSYETLSAEMQNILSFEYSQNLKICFVLLMLAFSLIYILYIKPKEQTTVFYSLGFMRIILSTYCFITLLVTPFFLFALSPEWKGYDFIFPYFYLYTIGLTLYLIFTIVDFMRFGVPVLLKMGGIDIADEETNKAYKKWQSWFKSGKG